MNQDHVTAWNSNEAPKGNRGPRSAEVDESSTPDILCYIPTAVYAARVQQVLRKAAAEARLLSQTCVDVEHVLLGPE